MKKSIPNNPTLPSVVQLGFSGSRELFDGVLTDSPDALKLCADAEVWLADRLAKIREELALDDNQFFVGISQIACGADTIFSKVCSKQSIPQRIFLPEHRDQFLSAVEPNGNPDFTVKQHAEAEELLDAEHIIQERCVVNSPDRTARFEETNVEIMRVSDAMICLLSAKAAGKQGGTRQLLERAIQRGMPVLEIQVFGRNGRFEVVQDQWHNVKVASRKPIKNLPEDLVRLPFPALISGQDPIPRHGEYCDALVKLATHQAEGRQRLFKLAAGLIIITHIAATVLAASALALHSSPDLHQVSDHSADDPTSHWLVLSLLLVELVFLVLGFGVHHLLHHSHAVQEWAISRVVCELVRSMRAIGTRHLYLEHLFRLQLPSDYRPLLRTLSVLHLHSTWPQRNQPWETQRDQYSRDRFDDPVNGQLRFFEKALQRDERLMINCQRMFTICSVLAMVATTLKIYLLWSDFSEHLWLGIFGCLAVKLPVLAVAGLSWAAAVDCEARVETFRETLHFLHLQRPYLEQAASGSEFDRLLIETETVLLGEITSWYSRRANKGVS